jgi:hypothetical protein
MDSIQFFKKHTNLPNCYLLTYYGDQKTLQYVKDSCEVDIIGPEWIFLRDPYPINNNGADNLVQLAHSFGYLVHPYTHKDDDMKFSKNGSCIEEYEFYM